MTQDQIYINRCLELAKFGLGTTYPNPLVGSVIVYKNEIIGEGWHKKSGQAHAEVNAIASVKDKSLLKESTLYVNLEPCSHFGKTPPCADLIIEHKIPKVVIGTIDPFAKVCGNGISKLQQAGVEVSVGFLEDECKELNKRFFTFHQKKRPYVILKWAQTLDGFIAPLQKEVLQPVWISNPISRQLVHKFRSEEQAILVGTNTVLDDNPRLDVRTWTGEHPTRIVLDRQLRIPRDFSVYDKSVKTIFITEKDTTSEEQNIFFETIDFDNNRTQNILNALYKQNIQSVIVEGGKAVLESFIEDGLWDEARVFTSDITFENGIQAPFVKGESISKIQIENDELVVYKNASIES